MQLKEKLNIAWRGEGMENFFRGSTVEVEKTSRKDLLGKVSQLFLLPIVAKCWQGHGFSAFKVNVTLFVLKSRTHLACVQTKEIGDVYTQARTHRVIFDDFMAGFWGKTPGDEIGFGHVYCR